MYGKRPNGLGKSQGWLGEPDEESRELDELDEQLGESDEDRHETRRVDEQLVESDEFPPKLCTRMYPSSFA